MLWVWDNVEPVTGYPAGTPSAWTAAEQDELAVFLRELAGYTRCKVLLTSRRDEQEWLGNLAWRVSLPQMPMLERLELAQAVAARRPGADRARQDFLAVADWRPLLAFSQGNPLAITVLVRQALRDHLISREQIEAFVAGLRAGAAQITDDAAQGRDSSLAASLNYGFIEAFTEAERAVLALLSLFQGFADVDVLCFMGDPEGVGEPVPMVAGLDPTAGIALLDRAAEVGLLTAWPGGYYAIHPAVPWHLRGMFERYYGPPGAVPAGQAIRAWTEAISVLSNDCHDLYEDGHTDIIDVLGAQEANLLQARMLAREHSWLDLAMKAMQGLRVLYDHTGRAIEWRRLVAELAPSLADPATGGPLHGREEQWALLAFYRVLIAQRARDWPTAEQLQRALIAWHREKAADALTISRKALNNHQRTNISNLAVAVMQLGHIRREQQQPSCTEPYLEAIGLFQRIGAHRDEAGVAFHLGNAYKDVFGLRDLTQAERWYQHRLELLEEDDTLGRARTTHQLGSVAYQRFREARDAGKTGEQLFRHLNDAAAAYHWALERFPADAINDLAATHRALGNVYADADDADSALRHYQKAIHYSELSDDRYGAGAARFDAAITLMNAGRRSDALLYARAALRDLDTASPGFSAYADKARRLIAHLEQEPPDWGSDVGTYRIICVEDGDGNVSLWYVDTSAGRFVMMFSDMGNLAEVVTYAERHGKGPDQQISVMKFTVDSPAQVKSKVGEARLAVGATSMNYVTEGEEMFDDLLAQIREQNATGG